MLMVGACLLGKKKRRSPKYISEEERKKKFEHIKTILVIHAEEYVNRSIARMYLKRHRLAKKRKVDYIV